MTKQLTLNFGVRLAGPIWLCQQKATSSNTPIANNKGNMLAPICPTDPYSQFIEIPRVLGTCWASSNAPSI